MLKSQLKFVRSLHLKKYRDAEKMYIAEGLKLTSEAVRSGKAAIKAVYYTPDNMNHLKGLNLPNDIIHEITGTDFQKISILKNPQGLLTLLKQPPSAVPEISKTDDLILVLDGIRDPGNLGTIIRLADWFGVQKIICSQDTVECFNPKVVQATMGSIFRVRVHYLHLPGFLSKLKKEGTFTIYGTSLSGGNIYNSGLKKPAAIVLGSESHGLSEETGNLIHSSLLIPNFSKSEQKPESLNVSLAAAILCSEFRRVN